MTERDKNQKNGIVKTLALYILVWAMMSLFYGCTTVSAPSAGTGTLWGYVTLKPPKGVNPFATRSAGYGDRRLRDIEFVDYRNPEFAVVYFDGAPPSSNTIEVKLIQTQFGPRFNTVYSAIGLNGTVVLRNEDRHSHVFSCREAGLLTRLAPGEQTTIPTPSTAEYSVFILDDINTHTSIYVVPGPFSLASNNGRWELRDLPPGSGELWAWHPGFPPISQNVTIKFDSVQRVDFEIDIRKLPKIGGGMN